MAEYALAMPVLILLLFGMTLAGFTLSAPLRPIGASLSPALPREPTKHPLLVRCAHRLFGMISKMESLPVDSLANRQVRSQIGIVTSRPWVFGLNLVEAHRGTSYFRLWRFYPGPPASGGVE